jgi:hypothetical protein
VKLAQEAGGLIFAFNVKATDREVSKLCEEGDVELCSHKVIYALIDDARRKLTKFLPLREEEQKRGTLKVIQTFELNGSKSQRGGVEVIAGGSVMEGACERGERQKKGHQGHPGCGRSGSQEGLEGARAKRARRRSVLLRRKRATERASESSAKKESFCGGSRRAEECPFAAEAGEKGLSGGRPPEPPLRPARSHMCSLAHALCRTCALPHMRSAAHALCRTRALPHMR